MGALLTFLGGSVFRMLWGEISSWMQKQQEHKHELEKLRASALIEEKRIELDMKRVQQAHELGIKEIQIAGDVALQKVEMDAWAQAVSSAVKPIGVAWVDAWNASIRPSYATIALLIWLGSIVARGFTLVDWDLELGAAIAGFYFADRSLGKRGK